MTDSDWTVTERKAAMGEDVVRYTTAPDSYDGFGTRTVEPSCACRARLCTPC